MHGKLQQPVGERPVLWRRAGRLPCHLCGVGQLAPAIAPTAIAVASAIAATTVAVAVTSASAIAATTVAVAVTSASATTVILGELRGLDVQPGGVGDSARQYRGLRWHELWSADPVGSSRRGRHCGLCRVQ